MPRYISRGFVLNMIINELLDNIEYLHTTQMGDIRIKRNLQTNEDSVIFCKKINTDKNCVITRKGKNHYCELNNILITVNAYSYTIITAHKI